MSTILKKIYRFVSAHSLRESLTYHNLAIVGFMLLVALCRVTLGGNESLGIWARFTPIGAMALFGGAYFSRYRALAFPLITLWISDLYLNRYVYYGEWRVFYEGFYWTYGAFVMMVWVGRHLLYRVSVTRFLFASVLVTFIHWTVTNLSVCMTGGLMQPTLTGYLASLQSSVSYEINFLAGTVLYGTVSFGVFEWMRAKNSRFDKHTIKPVSP